MPGGALVLVRESADDTLSADPVVVTRQGVLVSCLCWVWRHPGVSGEGVREGGAGAGVVDDDGGEGGPDRGGGPAQRVAGLPGPDLGYRVNRVGVVEIPI